MPENFTHPMTNYFHKKMVFIVLLAIMFFCQRSWADQFDVQKTQIEQQIKHADRILNILVVLRNLYSIENKRTIKASHDLQIELATKMEKSAKLKDKLNKLFSLETEQNLKKTQDEFLTIQNTMNQHDLIVNNYFKEYFNCADQFSVFLCGVPPQERAEVKNLRAEREHLYTRYKNLELIIMVQSGEQQERLNELNRIQNIANELQNNMDNIATYIDRNKGSISRLENFKKDIDDKTVNLSADLMAITALSTPSDRDFAIKKMQKKSTNLQNDLCGARYFIFSLPPLKLVEIPQGFIELPVFACPSTAAS